MRWADYSETLKGVKYVARGRAKAGRFRTAARPSGTSVPEIATPIRLSGIPPPTIEPSIYPCCLPSHDREADDVQTCDVQQAAPRGRATGSATLRRERRPGVYRGYYAETWSMPNAGHAPSASARRLHALVRPTCDEILAQRICSLGIRQAPSNVTPAEVEVQRVRAGFETHHRVAGVPDGGFGVCQ